LWGVTPGPSQRVETVVWRGRSVGREWTGPDFRVLLLASIDGTDHGHPGDPPAVTPPVAPELAETTAPAFEEARRMFERASSVLAVRGFSYRQVARTWIYLSHLLDCYARFNQVRNAHHDAAGLSAAGGFFPASTGIQARHDREECLMDVLAIDARPGSGLVVRPITRSDRQGEAFAYGSAFARAMVIERAGRKIIHVSGTASIDDAGRSTHPDDAGAQYCETLLSIAALLEREGATLADIAQGTLFTKTLGIARTCREVTRRLGLQPLPLVEIVADVCRPELLVEIEAVALLQGP
jgi:enamine deaminase RidA (YjgF/YER057c/UK114 family)